MLPIAPRFWLLATLLKQKISFKKSLLIQSILILWLFLSSKLSITVWLDNIQPLGSMNCHLLDQWSSRYSQCLFIPLFSCFTTVLTPSFNILKCRTVPSIRLWLQQTAIHHMVNGVFDEVIYICKYNSIPTCTSILHHKHELKHLQ